MASLKPRIPNRTGSLAKGLLVVRLPGLMILLAEACVVQEGIAICCESKWGTGFHEGVEFESNRKLPFVVSAWRCRIALVLPHKEFNKVLTGITIDMS